MQAGSTDTSRLEESDVFVDFNESCILPYRKVYHLTKNILHEADLDLAILEIFDPDEELPPALYLGKNNDIFTNVKTVSVIGYGHPQKMEKILDPNCEVIQPNSPQIRNAKQVMSATLNNISLVDLCYEGYDRPDKFLLHCYSQHGASGAPIVVTNGLHLLVIGMLTHGLPAFYYNLAESDKQLVSNEVLFEMGTRMSFIYMCIKRIDSSLARDLFGE